MNGNSYKILILLTKFLKIKLYFEINFSLNFTLILCFQWSNVKKNRKIKIKVSFHLILPLIYIKMILE